MSSSGRGIGDEGGVLSEEEGEILYGMGLYDAPEKPLVMRDADTAQQQLGYHRYTIASLLGSYHAHAYPSASYPEPTGKGLKLEDAWEPPASDDGDDGDDEDRSQAEDDDDNNSEEQE